MEKGRAQTLCRFLDEARGAGRNQKEIAAEAGISGPQLSMYKAGTVPNVVVGQRIAKALRKTVEQVWPLGEGDEHVGTG